jgi:hypothetical protein
LLRVFAEQNDPSRVERRRRHRRGRSAR